jgi:hypothetical protein
MQFKQGIGGCLHVVRNMILKVAGFLNAALPLCEAFLDWLRQFGESTGEDINKKIGERQTNRNIQS